MAAWTPEEDDLLRRCVDEGKSISKTAAELGRPMSTVKDHAKLLGLNWSRQPTPEAGSAHRVDARERRATFREAFMKDLERLREQLFEPVTVYNFGGKDNTFEEAVLDQPAIADQLRLVQSISAGMATLERMEAMDADQSVADVVGMLDRIAEAIEKAAEEAAELL